MSFGNGCIITQQRQIVSGAPFAAGSADNGVSVDPGTGKIVLGDDGITGLGKLLSNRVILQQGFTLELLNQFGAIDFTEAQMLVLGDEANGVPAQINWDDNTSGGNNAGAILLKTLARLFIFFHDSIAGDQTGFFLGRDNVQCGINTPDANVVGALMQVNGGFATADPGSGKGAWMLGKKKAGAVALDAANYVEVKIDGGVVKLLIAS